MAKLNDILEKKMQNPEFRDAFAGFEQDFQLAQQLIAVRKAKGLTQKQLAEMAQTSQSAIARLESGQHRNLTLAFLQKICHVLGLAPEIRLHELS